MRQEQVILDAVQNPIDDVEEYPDARQVESIKGVKDHIGAVTIPASGKAWHFANEPNENTRLWLWFREGWRLRDYSRHGNDAFADQMEPAPYPVENYVPLRRKINDDLTTSGRLHGIIDGKTQYYRVHDGPENRMTDLLVSNNEISFSIFFSPFQTYILDEDDCATVFQKLDDDQSDHAIRVCVEEDGTVQFHIAYQGFHYNIETAPDVVPFMEIPEFVPGQFIDEEFLTQSTKPWQWNPDVQAPDWVWLFFTFNKVSKQLTIKKVADGGFSATELVTSSGGDETGFLSNVSLWIKGVGDPAHTVAAYDVINDHDAVFAASPNNPTYDPAVSHNMLHFSGDTQYADIASHIDINALSSAWTVAFKIRLDNYASSAVSDIIMGKDVAAAADGVNGTGAFIIYMFPSGSKTLAFTGFTNGSVVRTFSLANAIPNLGQWYSVIITYDGSNYNLSVDNTAATPLAGSSDVYTNAQPWRLGHVAHSFHGHLADFVVVKGEVWSTTKKNWYKALTAGYRGVSGMWPDWKPPKPPEPETPLPVVRPVENVYELVLSDGAAIPVNVNAPASTTPFVSVYNVPGGTPATTPEVLQYDVADGTTGGGGTVPISTIYNLAAASSTGNIAEDETGYIQRIVDTSSVLYNKKPTDLQFWINDSGGDCDGMAYPAIIRTNGTYTKIGAGMNVSSLTSTWTSISGVSYVDRTALAVGDGVGIIREGHTSGTLGVRRGGSDVHYDNAGGTVHSYQHRLTGTTITNPNDEWSIAGTVKVGGETLPGTNPYVKMGTTNRRMAHWQQNSTLENIASSKVIFRVRRVGSAASATLICVIRNASNTELYRFPQTISFNSISTTVQDLQFNYAEQAVQFVDGYRLSLEYDNITGINDTTNYLEVNFNQGPSSTGVFGGTTWKAQYYKNVAPIGWYDISPQCDLAGKIYTGGSTFTSYYEFTPTSWAITEKINAANPPTNPPSKLIGQKHSKFNVILKKSGSPSGPIRVKVWDFNGFEKAIFTTVIDASSLTTSDATYVFTYPLNSYVSSLNDRIGVEFFGSTATDKVLIKINTDAAAGAPADGTKSIISRWVSGTGWVDDQTLDLAGEIFTGGVPDTTSKPKVAIRCDSIFSRISQKKITRAIIPIRKFGAPTGTYYIRSVRGSDSSNRDLLGSGDISALSTSTWTYKDVSNYTATHFLGESDKIVVEFEGGDPTNGLQVQTKQDSTYDDEDTRFEAFDAINWNKEAYTTWDMAATLYTGGDTYIPDAGTPYVEPPDFYDHDLLIGGGAFVEDQFTSFYGMRIRDFKIETSIPSLEQMDTLYNNKYSRRGGAGEVALMGYATLNDETTAPP